jgi:hypothetical protein
MKAAAVAVFAVAMASQAQAQLAAGTWVMRESPQISMVVVPKGSGYSITYHILGKDGKPITMTLQTPLDGSETPFLINGKPTGQTYAGRRIDSRHTIGVIKMDGKPFGTSKAELSADGKTITVENDNTGPSGSTSVGKRIEHWDKR